MYVGRYIVFIQCSETLYTNTFNSEIKQRLYSLFMPIIRYRMPYLLYKFCEELHKRGLPTKEAKLSRATHVYLG